MAEAREMVQAFVAIGSNVDPAERMLQAARAIKQRFADARFSRCYRNPAFGFKGPDFYNAVAGFTTTLPIEALLPSLREIEVRCGRGRADPRWGPRKMDLDLLLYDDVVGAGRGYTLPRRDLRRRVYMLGPLAELAPDWLYPPSGPTIARLWEQFPQSEHVLAPLELDLNAL
ncbi:MAG: 2-amino-4-hydroxy-6-hydroxymethyldihydropteridine diphosphokinase [Steroidobacteraceae bacterium]|jgi:2-amino-4-hydroxy-6-hydroxymethyldihydropteridine diphosphokinase